MVDKRTIKRRHLIYYLSVFDKKEDQLVGQLVDISTRGIMLTSENPIEKGKEFELRMVLPDVIEGDNQISFEAKSVWCEKDVNPYFYGIGLEFTEISRKTMSIIESLIQDFSFLE